MLFGSLFTGIGGFDLGLERAGMNCAWQVENDRFCQRTLARHWPHIERFGDVREFSPCWDIHAVDLICGGFPCQDLSVAGKRAGLSGERSGLFWELVRVASILRPEWLVLENVPGLLSSENGRDMGAIIGALADIGYSVCWRVLDSQFFGVAQRRRRVFFVCHPDPQRAASVLFEPEGGEGNTATVRETGAYVAYSLDAGTGGISGKEQQRTIVPCIQSRIGKAENQGGSGVGYYSESSYTIDSGGHVGAAFDAYGMRTAASVSEALDLCPVCEKGPDGQRYRALGNAVTATVAEWIGRRIMVEN